MTAVEEHLTDGWEPGAPIGDTLLRRYVFNLAASNEAPVVARGGRALRRDDFAAADLGRPSGMFNVATLLRPLPWDRADEVVRAIEDFFGDQGTGDVMLWSAWPTPDLRSRGWKLEGHTPLLIRAPAPLPPARGPASVRVEQVIDEAGVRDWEHVAVNGFPFPEMQPLETGSLVDEGILTDQRMRMWVGYDKHEPVCIGTLFVDCGLANFQLGVTMPKARGRGCWETMARTRILAEPDLLHAAVFSDLSRPLAEKIGFLPISRFTLWLRSR
jgi:hypothetical protein